MTSREENVSGERIEFEKEADQICHEAVSEMMCDDGFRPNPDYKDPLAPALAKWGRSIAARVEESTIQRCGEMLKDSQHKYFMTRLYSVPESTPNEGKKKKS